MIRRPSKKRFRDEPGEAIHIIALWNLMIILIPFLLLSAVFSKTSILNVYLPEAPKEAEARTPAPEPEKSVLIIVSILKNGFVIQDGERVLAALPKIPDGYDFEKLSTHLLELKKQLPRNEEIILLSEPDIAYETIIQTMDASREIQVEREGSNENISLFPNVSIGEVGKITFQEVFKPEAGKSRGKEGS